MTQKRKMAFYEIDQGRLALETQKAFENIQRTAMNEGADTELQLVIKVSASKDNKYGGISYSIKEKHPPRKSIKLTTQLSADGIIVADGTSQINVLQEELEFEKPKLHQINGSSK